MFCLQPLLLAGYLFTLLPNASHVSRVDAATFEVQTCEVGAGAHVKATTNGLYSMGVQYGFSLLETDKLSLTFQPKVGLSYSAHEYRELPMQGQFEVGAQFLLGYERYRVGVEYWHWSNAGLQAPNIGLDMVTIQTGVTF